MNRHRPFCFAAAALAVLAATAATGQPRASFSISGTRVLKDGSEFLARGICVDGPGMQNKRKVVTDVDSITRVWRFNLIRVACRIRPPRTEKSVPDPNDLDEIVRTFTGRGVVVVIDPRDRVGAYYTDEAKSQTTPGLSDLTAWYRDVAARYRSNPFVWFEAMSSPGARDDGKVDQTWLWTHEAVVKAIRTEAGADNIILCEGDKQGVEVPDISALPVDEASSALLSFAPTLAQKYTNLLFGMHIDDRWNAGAAKLEDFVDRVRAHGLALMISEYGSSRWADSTPAIEGMFAVCKSKRVGRCAWNWSPTESQHLCASDDRGGGWQIDTLDGSKPTDLSWLGDHVWDDCHGLVPLHGPLLDRTHWTATSFRMPGVPDDYNNQPDSVFGDFTSDEDYWSTRKAQEPGQWFQIDMGARQTFSRVLIDSRGRYPDYPRGYELYVSNDGVNWGKPVASRKNDQTMLRLTLPTTTARYLKIVQTAKTWHHWQIGSIEVYAPIGSARQATAVPLARETVLEPRAWSASAGPNRWYQAELPLRPLRDPFQTTGTGEAQRPGHYFQIDMGEPQRFHKIVLNCGRNLNDFPRGYEVAVSSDGTEWSKPVAAGRGAPITTIVFPIQTARFVRITLTRHCRNYWALSSVRLYGEAQGAGLAAPRP